MKKSKYSEAKIVAILKEAEAGMTVAEITRKYGVSNGTFYNWNLQDAIQDLLNRSQLIY